MYLKYLYFILLTYCMSCNSKTNTFKLNPVLHEVYNYLIIKTSSQEWTYQNIPHKTFYTLQFNIGLELIKNNEDTIRYKLTFNNLKLIRPPFKITITNSNIHSTTNLHNPIQNPVAFLDSICFYLRGLSIQFDISSDGNVTEVFGIEELIANISTISKMEMNTVRGMLSDYVSINAIKDLLNRMLSIPNNKEVKISDRWVKNTVLITKAPVKISNMYTLEKVAGDSAYVDIQSMMSTAITTQGDNVYLKGKQEGEAILSYNTGMPYKYDSDLQTITTTTYYDVDNKEHLSVKRIYATYK